MKAVCSFQVCSASAMCRVLCLLLVLFTSAEVFSQDTRKSTQKKSTQKSRQAAILFNTASRLYRQKNWQDAAATFGDFIKRYPKHEDALESHFARGYCFNRLKQHAMAVADLKIAGAQKGSRWSGAANFYLGRSLEALPRLLPRLRDDMVKLRRLMGNVPRFAWRLSRRWLPASVRRRFQLT